MGLILGGVPPHDLILDSQSASLYVGGNPPVKVWPTWPTVVQITLDTGLGARNQLRAALADRGLDYTTVTEIPFDIELVGTGEARAMFSGCSALTSVPDMDTSSVTSMASMFYNCSSLTTVPDMDTSSVTTATYTFYYCSSLTDGNVRLMGKHPQVDTAYMIVGSGLTREPWYNADGRPVDTHHVTLTDKLGSGTLHPMVSVTPPAGQTWDVQVTGTMTKAFGTGTSRPRIQIGGTTSAYFSQGATVDITGTITSSSATIALRTSTGTSGREASFTGTVTITRSI